jgi:hypothetical protein
LYRAHGRYFGTFTIPIQETGVKMRKTVVFAVTNFAAVLFASFAVSASAADVANIMQMERAQLQADRKVIVGQAMQLNPDQTEKFWALYDDYAAERKKNGDRMQKIILDYAKNYPAVPDDVARKLMDDWLKVQSEDLRLKKKYVGKFKKVLKPQQLVRYFQTENKLDAIIDFGLAADIPLMEKK